MIDHHRRLDLGVVVRVVVGEEADPLRVQGLEAGRRVRDLLPDEQRDEPREEADAGAARERRPVGVARICEARADDDVGVSAQHGLDQLRQLRRVVLAVAVEPDRELVAVRERVHEAGLDGAADPEVEREPDDRRARRRPRARRCDRRSRRRSRRRRGEGRRRGSRRRPGRSRPPRPARERSRFAAPQTRAAAGVPAPTSSSSCCARRA